MWRAITESEHLRHWLPTDIVGPRAEGAEVLLPFWPAHTEVAEAHGMDEVLTGVIRVWDPPSVFEWTWDTQLLRWELHEVEGGMLLRFTTWIAPDDDPAVRTATGYHVCLDALAALLDTGAPPADAAPIAPLEARYRAIVPNP